jgi:hypothetical protein
MGSKIRCVVAARGKWYLQRNASRSSITDQAWLLIEYTQYSASAYVLISSETKILFIYVQCRD